MNQPCPRCPQCKSADLKHESGTIHQCNACGYRCRVVDNQAKSLVDFTTAGRTRLSKAPPTLKPLNKLFENWE